MYELEVLGVFRWNHAHVQSNSRWSVHNSTQSTLSFVCIPACDDMTVCFIIGLARVADAYRSQTRSGSHPFTYISPPSLLKGPLHSQTGNHVMASQSPGNSPVLLLCLAFHETPWYTYHISNEKVAQV